jgi:O-antigen/teichoic acid export membrane protein
VNRIRLMALDQSTLPTLGVGRGAALLSARNLLSALTSALATVAVARILGPAGTGQLAVAVGLLTAMTVLAPAGTQVGVTWVVSSGRADPDSTLATMRVASTALGAAGFAVGLAIYESTGSVFRGVTLDVIVPILAVLPPALVAASVVEVALGCGAYGISSTIPGINSLAYLAAVAPLAVLFGTKGVALALLLAACGSALSALALSDRLRTGRKSRIERQVLRESFRFGFKAYLANVLGMIIYRFDLFILGAYSGARQLGYYSVAVSASTIVMLGPGALSAVLFPRLAALEASNRHADAARLETRVLRHTTLALLVGGVVVALGFAFLAGPIFGQRFSPAVVPGLVLVPGAAALAVAGTFYAALAGHGRPDYALVAGLIIAPLAVGLYLVLIPEFDATGAALGSTISYGLSAALAGFLLRRHTGKPLVRRLLPGLQEFRDYRALAERALAALPRAI